MNSIVTISEPAFPGMRLVAAELGEERHRGRRILRAASESPENHAHVLTQGASKAGTGEELVRLAVVIRAFVNSEGANDSPET